MKNSPFLLFATLFVLLSCEKPAPTDLSKAALIPFPKEIFPTHERFCLQNGTVIHVWEEDMMPLAKYLEQALEAATQLDIIVEIGDVVSGPGHIIVELMDDYANEEGPEFYELSIKKKKVHLMSKSPAGLFQGLQTLLQLLPTTPPTEDNHWVIASGVITDAPLYDYRGAMLDVSRHFFGVEDVKRFIDLIALCKINYLHLHLADDQGWRIEIKSWPNLTTHGGSTQVDGGAGGYYTQEDYQEIVRYAESSYVTIVPEIDMPGHTNAALASYPELNCNGVSPDLYTGTEVGFSTLCTSKEIVYQFVEDVVREISAMTPGPYFHIGGDESHVTALEDYIPFIERVQDIVTKYDKQVIGWDEISHAKLRQDAVVQYWAKAENALRGVAQGNKVLLSPAHKVYLDMQYDSTTELGLHWAAYIELDSAYLWSPETLVPGIGKENILGIESPLWTETITKMDEIEYMVFPRLLAHAELSWSPAEVRNWPHFSDRLVRYAGHLKRLDVDYYASPVVKWE
jgi:hexosaminidase